jgi:hypothetical protein
LFCHLTPRQRTSHGQFNRAASRQLRYPLFIKPDLRLRYREATLNTPCPPVKKARRIKALIFPLPVNDCEYQKLMQPQKLFAVAG